MKTTIKIIGVSVAVAFGFVLFLIYNPEVSFDEIIIGVLLMLVFMLLAIIYEPALSDKVRRLLRK